MNLAEFFLREICLSTFSWWVQVTSFVASLFGWGGRIHWLHLCRGVNTRNECFDLIRSHQLYIPISPLLEIEPATTECRAEPLPLNYWSPSLTGFSGNGNLIYDIIPLLKKEKVHLFLCPWGYDYVDAYLQSSWEDVTPEVTVSSVKSTDVTYKIPSA